MGRPEILNRYKRQQDIINANSLNAHSIVMVGAGGIGSPTVLALAKMGARHIDVIDFDTIEEHNIPNQFYPTSAIGKSKVETLAEVVQQFTDTEICTYKKKIEKPEDIQSIVEANTNNIVIAGPDNIDARKTTFAGITKNKNVKAYIDCRVTYPFLSLQVINPQSDADIERYMKTTNFEQKDAIPGKCTAQATIYTSFIAASFIAMCVREIISSKTPKYKKINMSFDPLTVVSIGDE